MFKSKRAARFLTRFGISLGIFGFAVLAATAADAMLEFREFSRLELHTNEVVGQLRQVDAMIERAETSQRGYLLTRQISFLQPYHASTAAVKNEVAVLKRMISDNPRQLVRVQEAERLIARRLQKMDAVLDGAGEMPLEKVAKTIDVDTMAELREAFGAIEAEEQNLLKVRRASSERFSRLSLILLSGGGIFAFFLMILSARLVQQATKRNIEQTSLINQVFDSMTDGLIVVDKNQVLIHSNRASDEFSEGALKGKTIEEFYEFIAPRYSDDRKDAVDYRSSSLYRALHGETVLRFEVTMGKKVRRLVSVDARAVRGEDGEIVAAFCTYQDITQRRAIEQEWQNARESALQASRLKSDFLATMSHEIRTPMNGVMGMATLLLATEMSEEQRSYVKTIKGSADSLLSLINQVLDHSKIEAGKLELEKQDFNLAAVTDGVFSLFRYLARSKNIELKVMIDPAVPPALRGDPNRLRQILLNLVGNALKFTERGYVELAIKSMDQSGHRLEFSVKDTGPGIPADKQGHLFEKFSQVHDQKFVKVGGSGLGLMISRELVQIMGGEMGMESVVGLGSRFWFTAVFDVAETADHGESASSTERENLPGRILVAEDQPVNQMVIQKFLQSFGLDCVMVDEGGAAVKLAREERFDLILMDCRMIPMDGYEATRQIRTFDPLIPIVALTAEGVSGDRKLCLDCGMNEIINKPVDIDHLYQVLQGYLSQKEFDESQLDKLAGYDSGDKSLVEVLSEDFYANGRELVKSLRESVQKSDIDSAKHFAHALRSPALTLGLSALARLCADIEDNAAPGPALNLKVAKLEELYNRACGWLSRQTKSSKAA